MARLVFMNCPICGEVCRCQSEPGPTVRPRWRADAGAVSASVTSPVSAEAQWIDPEAPDLSEQMFAASLENSADAFDPGPLPSAAPESQGEPLPASIAEPELAAASSPASAPVIAAPEEPADAWRDEVSARLSRYRARRKVRPPRYPSLTLQFDPPEPKLVAEVPAAAVNTPSFEPVSQHALALDGLRQSPPEAVPTPVEVQAAPETETPPPALDPPPVPPGAKILEFPRFACAPPPPPPDQLAEPVTDRPRILDVPETSPPPRRSAAS